MHGNPWYFDADATHWDPSAIETIVYVTRLCENPVGALETLTDTLLGRADGVIQ